MRANSAKYRPKSKKVKRMHGVKTLSTGQGQAKNTDNNGYNRY